MENENNTPAEESTPTSDAFLDGWGADGAESSETPEAGSPESNTEEHPESETQAPAPEAAESKPDASAAPETPPAEKPEEPPKPEEPAAPAPEVPKTWTLRHLGEEKAVNEQEITALAQKGLDYDRVREKYDAAKPVMEMQIIQALDDEPNDVGGMSAAELKAKYDEGGEAVKTFFNDVLLPALDAYIARTDNPHAVTKAQVGLGAADNTADADKPISTVQQAAFDGKADKTTTVNGHALSANVTVTKADVGLGNLDNTSDMDKPISTAQQATLSLKANRADVLEKGNTTVFTPTENYQPSTKKYVDDLLAAIVLGQIPDHSITSGKLAEEVISSINSKASGVHAANHAAGGSDPLTPEQIGAATAAALAAHTGRTDNPHGVTPEKIGAAAADHAHTAAQVGADPAGSAAAVLAQLQDRARIAAGSYVGTGTFGPSSPSSLTFGFVPKIVIIYVSNYALQEAMVYRLMWYLGIPEIVSAGGFSQNGTTTTDNVKFSLSGTTLSWYGSSQWGYQGRSQCNTLGDTYNYIAIG